MATYTDVTNLPPQPASIAEADTHLNLVTDNVPNQKYVWISAGQIGVWLAVNDEEGVLSTSDVGAQFPAAFSRVAVFTKADITAGAASWTTGHSPISLFTVTGQVLCQVYAVITTGFTSTGTNGTVAIGVSGNTASLLPQTTADGTNFPTGAVWTDSSPTLKAESLGDAYAAVLVNSNIIGTIATNSMTAGGIVIFCRWVPISDDGEVVAA